MPRGVKFICVLDVGEEGWLVNWYILKKGCVCMKDISVSFKELDESRG